MKTAKAFPKTSLRKAFGIHKNMICKGVLLILEELLHFVFVYHHLFVGVLARFGIFDALNDFDEVTT